MAMLSPHFSLEEMTLSQEAVRKGWDNTASPEIVQALTDLCVTILEPIRAEFGLVHINSGYRSPQVNEAIGGVATSQHCLGEAADLICPGYTVEQVSRWVAASGLPFDQVIYEFGRWTHCSFTTRRTVRGQVLTASKGLDGRTVYSEGVNV